MKSKNKQPLLYLPLLVGSAWIAWWLWINLTNQDGSRDNFTDTYSLVALSGCLVGLWVAKSWGGFKSRFGRAIGFFALGLGLQFLGQLIYGLYFRLAAEELAYPSLGDIPYFLSYVAYIFAVTNLLGVIVIKKNVLKPWWVSVFSVGLTVCILIAMYVGFLRIAATDERGTLYSILNVVYPVVQAIYFLLGMIALLQSRLIAGGKMFGAVFLLLIALATQYAADFVFLHQSYHETWQAAGYNDLMFVMAYVLMAGSLIMIDHVRKNVLSAGENETVVS